MSDKKYYIAVFSYGYLIRILTLLEVNLGENILILKFENKRELDAHET